MTRDDAGFREFECSGWEDEGVVAHYARDFAAVTAQSIGPLLRAARVGPGTKLLDIASGPGLLTRTAAEAGAQPIGVDFSIAQIELARRLHPGLRFEVADASALPFAADSFDAVVISFGMLHFPDPDAAAREALRVLTPRGRFAFTVWDTPDRAIGMGALLAAVREHGSAIAPVPEGPAFFDLSDPTRSEQLLDQAGFRDIRIQSVPQIWTVASPDQVYEVLLRATVRMRALLRAQPASSITAIRTALNDSLCGYRRGDDYDLPMPALLATGEKPG